MIEWNEFNLNVDLLNEVLQVTATDVSRDWIQIVDIEEYLKTATLPEQKFFQLLNKEIEKIKSFLLLELKNSRQKLSNLQFQTTKHPKEMSIQSLKLKSEAKLNRVLLIHDLKELIVYLNLLQNFKQKNVKTIEQILLKFETKFKVKINKMYLKDIDFKPTILETKQRLKEFLSFQVVLFNGLLLGISSTICLHSFKERVPSIDYIALLVPILFFLCFCLVLSLWNLNHVDFKELEITSHPCRILCLGLVFLTIWGILNYVDTFYNSNVVICFFILVFVLVNPLPFFTERFWFLEAFFNSLKSPFFTVSVRDYLFADVLCSMVFSLSKISSLFIKQYSILFIIFPPILRLCQCLRKFNDSKLQVNLFNALKYSLVAICYTISFILQYYPSSFFRIVWITLFLLSTTYNVFWDLKIDWGLNKKKLQVKFVYFAMFSNILMRYSWALFVPPNPIFKSKHAASWCAVMEALRRAQWCFFRIENESKN